MATNTFRYSHNLLGLGAPLMVPGKFAAGSTAIKQGELLELTGNSNTEWVPMDSDYDMSAAAGSGGKVAIAACELKTGDLAGYYPIIVPRPGDVFRFTLLASDAQNPAAGTAVYWSTSERVTTTAGTNKLGHVAAFRHYPFEQGHASDDASIDRGTTLRNLPGGEVLISIEDSNSYFSALQQT